MFRYSLILFLFIFFGTTTYSAKARLLSWQTLEDDLYLKVQLNFDKAIKYSSYKVQKNHAHVYTVPNAVNSRFSKRQDLSHLLAISFWVSKYKRGLQFKFFPRGVEKLSSKLINKNKTLEVTFPSPYLARKQIDKRSENFVVCIDAGHGGQDPGAQGSFSNEKEVVLKMSRALRDEINKKPGLVAYMTRDSDYKIMLGDRGKINDYAGADVFISLHMNASVPSAHGFEIFYISKQGAKDYKSKSPKKNIPKILATKKEKSELILNEILDDLMQNETMNESALFAQALAYEMKKVKSRRNRGVRREAFVVLKNIETPSVLIELGFITNKKDEAYFNSKSSRQEMSKHIANGVVKFLQKYKSLPKTVGDSFYKNTQRPIITKYPKILVEYIDYKVKRGDTFLKIAKKFKVSFSKLKRANPKVNPDRLYVGKKLKIPKIIQ
ncbi:MAG: N-acetylmuramoyl-L-alanine amidase [Candidatus Cloacimonetes bacterium]|nr:N-acetylmuramoyl-L-alanine amidase [Candidatus Cloacimonadota bacterium]